MSNQIFVQFFLRYGITLEYSVFTKPVDNVERLYFSVFRAFTKLRKQNHRFSLYVKCDKLCHR